VSNDEGLFSDLELLTRVERSCLSRYLTLLRESLDVNLCRVVVFGSVARGESGPSGMPIRSDLDLLVVSRVALKESVARQLLDATLPLYLECGRQISPQFRTEEQLETETAATFRDHIARDGVTIYGE
jgi:predicted nucleotidyltransferase